ncbi:astacin [Dictyocaulus viviparus]|uniref:Metalloendopeptidase n=1 Tax=Dictyocaulus viviparus TaxID=29172 RepID=A0A0D8XGP6_DICVI|nr:astacin [Dictyocaulus viviparus]
MCPSFLILLLFTVSTSSASTVLHPNFLTEIDFINGARLPRDSKRMIPLFNDQRFPRMAKRGRRSGGVGVASSIDKWPGGRVPYMLSSAYNEHQRAVIASAVAGYQTKTCIRFVPRTPFDRDYVVISKMDGCYADFARVGGRQQVSLADECINYATVIHELMHVIGFIHEHQREDRDRYVSILYQNIIPGISMDFDKLSAFDLSYYGENYDYSSIMHYEKNEGSKNGWNTIEPKDRRYLNVMGRSTDFSASDLMRINRAYSCWTYLNHQHI